MLDSYLGGQSILLVPANVCLWNLIFLKGRKLQLLSIFPCQDIPKNQLHSVIMPPPHPSTSLKVTCKTIIFLKFLLVIHKEWFYFSKGSPLSHAIFKSILHVIQNVWHGEELLMNITLFNNKFLRYLLNAKLYAKTQWSWSSKYKISVRTIEKVN